MTTYESEIKTINQPQNVVFNKLNDLTQLRNLQSTNPERSKKTEAYFTDVEFEKDSVHFSVAGMGRMGFRIIEREPYKTIKLEAEGSPIAANGWVQLLPVSDTETKMKITIKAELPNMIKTMVDSKLKQGVDTIAEAIVSVMSDE
ncbi:MAG: SRPBCC family protein [Paludibacteraceae bacterium]